MSTPGRTLPAFIGSPTTSAAVELPDVEMVEALAVAHRLAVLAETDPAAPLIVATRAALEIADARRADRRARRIAGLEIHGGNGAWWARWAEQWIPAAELAARRAVPGPTTTTTCPDGEGSDAIDGAGGSRW